MLLALVCASTYACVRVHVCLPAGPLGACPTPGSRQTPQGQVIRGKVAAALSVWSLALTGEDEVGCVQRVHAGQRGRQAVRAQGCAAHRAGGRRELRGWRGDVPDLPGQVRVASTVPQPPPPPSTCAQSASKVDTICYQSSRHVVGSLGCNMPTAPMKCCLHIKAVACLVRPRRIRHASVWRTDADPG